MLKNDCCNESISNLIVDETIIYIITYIFIFLYFKFLYIIYKECLLQNQFFLVVMVNYLQ